MKKYISSISIGIAIVSIFLIGFVTQYYYNLPSYTTVPVARGPMTDEVYALGKVEPMSDAYLYFKNPGKVTNIYVKVGDSVKSGDVLASQDTKDIESQVVAINAGINVQRARISQLKAGSSQESIDIANTTVSNAVIGLANSELSLKNKKQEAFDTLKNTFTTADDIVRNKIDQMILNPQGTDPKLLLTSASNFGLGTEVEAQRVVIEATLKNWNDRLSMMPPDANLIDEIAFSKSRLKAVQSFLEKFSSLVNNPINRPNDISQTTWDTWRTNVAFSRTTADTLYSALTSEETAISNAESAVKVAKGALATANEQLQLTKAGTRDTDLAVYEAQLAEAAAARSKVNAQEKDLAITSPIAGLVSEVNAKVGELSGPSKSIVTVLSTDSMQIKVNVVENNITRVKVGQSARVTFDAMPNESFDGTVSAIEPAETEINGTIYYKTTVLLKKKEDFIRSGMTANVWIVSAVSDNALYIPVSALHKKDGKTFVTVRSGAFTSEKEIETGIKDSKGNIEVLSGLQEGEQVVTETITHATSL